jgi:hypothetical protein
VIFLRLRKPPTCRNDLGIQTPIFSHDRGEHGEKSFLFEKYSELCELGISVVKSDPEVSDFDIRISDFVSLVGWRDQFS